MRQVDKANKPSQNVFGQSMRTLTGEELDRVVGGGPYNDSETTVPPPGGKTNKAEDNQGWGFP